MRLLLLIFIAAFFGQAPAADISISVPVAGATLSDSSLVEMQRGNTEVGLKQLTVMADDFNDNSIDPAKWTEHDSGANVNEQNQRLEVVGTNAWDVNGVTGKTGVPANAANATFAVSVIPLAGAINYAGLKASFGYAAQGVVLSLNGGTTYIYTEGGAATPLYISWTAGKTYNLRFTLSGGNSAGNIWSVYLSSPDDALYGTERIIWAGKDVSNSTVLYPVLCSYGGTSYYDNVSLASLYSTAAPTATLIKVGGAANSTFKPSTFFNAANLGGETGNVKMQYCCFVQDDESDCTFNGSWLTIAGFQGVADIETKKWCKYKYQFNSDSSQDASFADSRITVAVPSGGGGIPRTREINN